MVLVGVGLRVFLRALPKRRRARALAEIGDTLAELMRSDETVTLVQVSGQGDGANDKMILARAEALAYWRMIRNAVEGDVGA